MWVFHLVHTEMRTFQEDDPFAAMDLSANILMVMGAIAALMSFLSVSAYLFTIYEGRCYCNVLNP